MAEKYEYMVDKRGPDLVRIGSDHVYRRYSPGSPKEWTESKFLDALGWGGGDWVWYDDITEEEAMQYMEQMRKTYEQNMELLRKNDENKRKDESLRSDDPEHSEYVPLAERMQQQAKNIGFSHVENPVPPVISKSTRERPETEEERERSIKDFEEMYCKVLPLSRTILIWQGRVQDRM